MYFDRIGTDEMSTAFTELINNEIIRTKLESDDFVAIRVQSDSEAYMQFAAICKVSHNQIIRFDWQLSIKYRLFNNCFDFFLLFLFVDKLVPLPSLFFIGKNGAPIEIVTGVTKTLDELNSKIDGVLNVVKPKSTETSSATASANLIASKASKKIDRHSSIETH